MFLAGHRISLALVLCALMLPGLSRSDVEAQRRQVTPRSASVRVSNFKASAKQGVNLRARNAGVRASLRYGPRSHTTRQGFASTQRPAKQTLAGTKNLLLRSGIGKKKIDSALLNIGLGMPKVAAKNTPESYLLARNQYVASYSKSRKNPNWVSWHLSAADLAPGGRSGKFRGDATIPKNWGAATDSDYRGSGYTRGHLVASGERHLDPLSNSKTFVFTNILPQIEANNAGPWLHLETHYRELVAQKGKEVFVMAGGIYEGPRKTIGLNNVAVPSHTWKVAVVVDKGTGLKGINASSRVISIIVPNEVGKVSRSQPFTDFRVSAKAIEKRTGLEFFQHLPPKLRTILRAKIDSEVVPR